MLSRAQVAELLNQTQHRADVPIPRSPWIGYQRWQDTCFAHWRVTPAALRSAVPPQLELDTFEASAWVTITPLRIPESRPRRMPFSVPCAEVNFRTYVRYGGIPGIYFFSLDCNSILSVLGAHTFYALPYLHADIAFVHDETYAYSCTRENGDANLYARFTPDLRADTAEDRLWQWLTQRFCLYTVRFGRVWRGVIHHLPWHLVRAQADISATGFGFGVSTRPPDFAHIGDPQDVLIWPPLLA
jgi:uncharacterized protein YqjF (DUF2071 family)